MYNARCSAPNCQMRTFNYSKEQIKLVRSDYTISFYKFPLDFEQRSAWIAAAKDPIWKPLKSANLCSLHFRDDCFDQRGEIFDHAIPTIFFSSFRDHLKKLVKERNLNVNFDSNDEEEEEEEVVSGSDDDPLTLATEEDNDDLVEDVEISISDYEDYEIDECEEITVVDSDDTSPYISPVKKSPVKKPVQKNMKVDKSASPIVKKKSPSKDVTQDYIQQPTDDREEESENSLQAGNGTTGSSQVMSKVDRLVAVKVSVPGEKAPSCEEISKQLFSMLEETEDSAKMAQVKPTSRSLVHQLLGIAQIAHVQNASSGGNTTIPNTYIITTKRDKKFETPPTAIDTPKVISIITRIVKLIKNGDFDLADNVSIICPSPTIFLFENVAMKDCGRDVNSIYVITTENLIPFLAKVDQRAEAVQQELKKKENDKLVLAKLSEPPRSTVKPGTVNKNILSGSFFPASTKKSFVTSTAASISSDNLTVTKPMVNIPQRLGIASTKPNSSTSYTTLRNINSNSSASTPLIKTGTTTTKTFMTSSPVSAPRSSFIINKPMVPKSVVNGSQPLVETSITNKKPVMTTKPFMKANTVNSFAKTSPSSFRQNISSNFKTIVQTNQTLQRHEMRTNSPSTSQDLANLQYSTIEEGDAIQISVPMQQLNLKPTLVQSVDASGNNILRRVAAPVRYAAVAGNQGMYRTITLPNTPHADGTPLQLLPRNSIEYVEEVTPNHFRVKTKSSDELITKPASVITNGGGYRELVLQSGSTIFTQRPNASSANSSQYVDQFLSKPATSSAAQRIQNPTILDHSSRKQIFARPSQSPSPIVYDVDDSLPASGSSASPSPSPSPFNSYVSESPAKKRKNEEDDESCGPESKKILDPLAYVRKQQNEIDVLEKSILRKERDISTQKKKLQTLKKRYLAVKNPCDTKSDEQLVEEILSKYFEQDAVQFFVGQMKVSGKTYTQYRWSEEDKLFALGLLYRHPLEYHVLFEKFTLPSDKTLSKFVSKIKKAEQGVRK